ncbi:MAG: glycosyltransferase family 4 protein [Bacillota bacterium]|nr:glycosyltransferase family 4 protein [Bacillota bacterium]
MFSWEFPPQMVGGLGQHVYDLSRFLVAEGIAVHIISPCVKDAPDHEMENGVAIHRVGRPNTEGDNFKSWTFMFNSEAIREAIRLSSELGGFDVIHAHDWLVAYAGRAVAKIFEIPLVSTIHATEHGRNLGLHNRTQREINEIEKNLALEADTVICCSQYMQKEICSLFDVKQNIVTIIPNGVDPQQFLQLPSKPLIEFDPGEKAVFFIGRLVPEKGVWQLISCFPKVLERVPEARLYIGGRGPQLNILQELANELGISDEVVFTGFLKPHQRNYVYKNASVAVFPSLYEPFGIVALEAMATKTPVIVGNVGGLSEIVQNEVDGLKVAPGNEKELSNAIISTLTDGDLANRLVENAYQEVKSVYNWEHIAASTIRVYETVIAMDKTHRNVG